MTNWVVLNADEVTLGNVSGVDVRDGVLRYVLMRHEDGSFGTITVGDRELQPAGSLVYVDGSTVHVQVS